jgi:hypothetical protein
MRSWLKQVYWYASVALRPDEELLEGPPVVTIHWNVQQKDENLVRFGRLWKCFDLVAFDYTPGLLPEAPPLCGGTDGSSFLVQAFGLEQPKAWRGVVRLNADLTLPTIHYKKRCVWCS